MSCLSGGDPEILEGDSMASLNVVRKSKRSIGRNGTGEGGPPPCSPISGSAPAVCGHRQLTQLIINNTVRQPSIASSNINCLYVS
jgi:hypothetical protein